MGIVGTVGPGRRSTVSPRRSSRRRPCRGGSGGRAVHSRPVLGLPDLRPVPGADRVARGRVRSERILRPGPSAHRQYGGVLVLSARQPGARVQGAGRADGQRAILALRRGPDDARVFSAGHRRRDRLAPRLVSPELDRLDRSGHRRVRRRPASGIGPFHRRASGRRNAGRADPGKALRREEATLRLPGRDARRIGSVPPRGRLRARSRHGSIGGDAGRGRAVRRDADAVGAPRRGRPRSRRGAVGVGGLERRETMRSFAGSRRRSRTRLPTRSFPSIRATARRAIPRTGRSGSSCARPSPFWRLRFPRRICSRRASRACRT